MSCPARSFAFSPHEIVVPDLERSRFSRSPVVVSSFSSGLLFYPGVGSLFLSLTAGLVMFVLGPWCQCAAAPEPPRQTALGWCFGALPKGTRRATHVL
jgi:hypothetical protein